MRLNIFLCTNLLQSISQIIIKNRDIERESKRDGNRKTSFFFSMQCLMCTTRTLCSSLCEIRCWSTLFIHKGVNLDTVVKKNLWHEYWVDGICSTWPKYSNMVIRHLKCSSSSCLRTLTLHLYIYACMCCAPFRTNFLLVEFIFLFSIRCYSVTRATSSVRIIIIKQKRFKRIWLNKQLVREAGARYTINFTVPKIFEIFVCY